MLNNNLKDAAHYYLVNMSIIAIALDSLGASILYPEKAIQLLTTELSKHPDTKSMVQHLCQKIKENNTLKKFDENINGTLTETEHKEWLNFINCETYRLSPALQDKIMSLVDEPYLEARDRLRVYIQDIDKLYSDICTETAYDSSTEKRKGRNDCYTILRSITPVFSSIPTTDVSLEDLHDIGEVIKLLNKLKRVGILSEEEHEYCMDPSTKMIIALTMCIRSSAINFDVVYQIRLSMRFDTECKLKKNNQYNRQ
jgi:hypothetical protein